MLKIITNKNTEEFLIFLSIFISSIVFFKSPFEGYFHYLIFILYLPFFVKRYGYPSIVLKLLLIPFIISVVYVFLKENTWFNFIKIYVGMLLSCSFYYYVFRHYKFDVVKLFRIFLKCLVIVACIGIVQAITYKLHITIGYDYGWLFNKWGLAPGGIVGIRINSIFAEPSQFATLLSPAAFISIHHILTKSYLFMARKWCYVILIAMFISASSTGYVGIFIAVLLILINYRRILDLIIVTSLGILIVMLLYYNVDEFKSRLDASINIYAKEELSLEDINSSSFVQYNNFHIATTNFMKNPLFGTGLGSYPLAYEKYSLTKAEDFLIKKGFEFNSQDANSLFLRVMAEMGLLGVLFLLLFVFKYFIIKDNTTNDNFSWLISSSILVLILLYFLRQGNYFLNGFPFFMWMYYYNYINRINYLNARN